MNRAPFLFPRDAAIGSGNVVLHARAKRHRVSEYAGPLSVKTVLEGQVSWIARGRELVVDQSSFLILSEGETYSMNIDADEPVETCCVFFRAGFVESVALDITSRLDDSLDDPARPGPALPWLSALHGDPEQTLLRRVHTLAKRAEQGIAPGAHEEEFLLAAEALLGYYARIRSAAGRLPAVRTSTRDELFRRILIGREYLHANTSRPVSLAAAARAACVSPFHFHRGFRAAFGETPHEYLVALRLETARQSLEKGSSVIHASLDAGFASPSAFSRAFRRRFGQPPASFRREFARSDKH